jgi:hypothetical protein
VARSIPVPAWPNAPQAQGYRPTVLDEIHTCDATRWGFTTRPAETAVPAPESRSAFNRERCPMPVIRETAPDRTDGFSRALLIVTIVTLAIPVTLYAVGVRCEPSRGVSAWGYRVNAYIRHLPSPLHDIVTVERSWPAGSGRVYQWDQWEVPGS